MTDAVITEAMYREAIRVAVECKIEASTLKAQLDICQTASEEQKQAAARSQLAYKCAVNARLQLLATFLELGIDPALSADACYFTWDEALEIRAKSVGPYPWLLEQLRSKRG